MMANRAFKKASHEDWHPADIKAAIAKAGWTLSALAAHHGLSSGTTISHTFLRSYPANERRIADAIGIPVQSIWPSRYFDDGTPRKRGMAALIERKSTRSSYQSNGKEGLGA